MKSAALRYLNKLLCLLLCVISLGMLYFGAHAQPASRCKLCIDFYHENAPVSNATFRIYRIANLGADRTLSYTEAFSDLRLDAEALSNAALDLYARVKAQNIQPEQTLITDDQGIAVSSDLAPGAFLFVGEPVTVEDFVHYVDQQVIFLEKDSQIVRPKSARLPVGTKLISINAVKQWEDQGYEKERPNAIIVRLLKDGKTVSSAVLSKSNGWSHTWNDLLPNARWAVEEDVPEGYTVTVRESNHTFTLTNQRKDIPQTGHIWWPVITMLCAGLALIVVGLSVRRSGRNEA